MERVYSFSVISARTLSLRGCRADVRQSSQAAVARHIPHKVNQEYHLLAMIPPRRPCACTAGSRCFTAVARHSATQSLNADIPLTKYLEVPQDAGN
jgi:hypothetical protein